MQHSVAASHADRAGDLVAGLRNLARNFLTRFLLLSAPAFLGSSLAPFVLALLRLCPLQRLQRLRFLVSLAAYGDGNLAQAKKRRRASSRSDFTTVSLFSNFPQRVRW